MSSSSSRWLKPLLLSLLLAGPAWAFPWMVKHNYGSCAACHVDPSGAGQLTQYGRAQSDILLRWHVTPRKEDDEVSSTAHFLWFLELPEVVNLSGNLRVGGLLRPGSTPVFVPQIMATELYGTVNLLERFVFHGSAGFGVRNYVAPAIVAPRCDSTHFAPGQTQCGPSFISREFWVGAKFAEEAVLVRAGRMNLPFGLRNNEHYMFVRDLTKTDINVGQQVGVAAAYNSELLRGEVMALLGNYQVGPDAYRERGYSLFAEYALKPNAYLGLSSMIAWSQADPLQQLPLTRHAHGLFVRVAPIESLAILGELDLLVWQQPGLLDRLGFAAMAQGDWEPLQGVHVMLTLEGAHTGMGEMGPRLGVWASAAWYLLPHVELRLDNVLRRSPPQNGAPGRVDYSLLFQLHTFL
ncbi:MAG: hypothetical protein IT380_21645 [Myxococcales bacterium]|nr:hypothetical protein [Myxococcales bacterium]